MFAITDLITAIMDLSGFPVDSAWRRRTEMCLICQCLEGVREFQISEDLPKIVLDGTQMMVKPAANDAHMTKRGATSSRQGPRISRSPQPSCPRARGRVSSGTSKPSLAMSSRS